MQKIPKQSHKNLIKYINIFIKAINKTYVFFSIKSLYNLNNIRAKYMLIFNGNSLFCCCLIFNKIKEGIDKENFVSKTIMGNY